MKTNKKGPSKLPAKKPSPQPRSDELKKKNGKFDEDGILELLLNESYISETDVKNARAFAKTHNLSPLDYLTQEQLINKSILGQAVAEKYKVSFADLGLKRPSKESVLKIPEKIAEKYKVVIFSENDKEVVIATDNLEQKGLEQELKKIFKGKKITFAYALSEFIAEAFVYYRKTLETRFGSIINQKGRIAPEIIDEIFEDALVYHASDIHFEPQDTDVRIRFRIDGVCHDAGHIPKEFYGNILNRIKVLSQLRIDEHFSPQDGAIRYVHKDFSIDLRVSIIPGIQGEKVVIRLLSAYVKSLGLSELGLTAENQEILVSAAKKPFGMILVVGPTGSGKSTTLYGVLRMLNKPELNITTIEDPVEYKIAGVNHIQVNSDTGMTFAKGLRSIVRQDPDIILVGEIRDVDTLEIAVNAALTGHLLLSTFHANDAAGAVPRLLDMGAEPFLLASTLELIVSQRLIRRVCTVCRYSYSEKISELQKTFPQAKDYFKGSVVTLYKSKGCGSCGQTGYKGRMALMELIRMTPEMKETVLKNPSSNEIWKLAEKQGSKNLFNDGLIKILNGHSTLEELLRVASPN